MEKDWKLVYSTGEEYLATMAKEILEDNNIPAVVLDRKDKVYGTFGDVEVYVNEKDAEKAGELLKQLKAGQN